LATFLAKALRIARSSHVESHPSVNINGNNVVLPQVSRSPAD
jgi:hypothetical protein